MEAKSSLFTGPYLKVRKTNPDGEVLEGATFEMYRYVEDGEDQLYGTGITDENGYAYFGHRNEDTNGVTIDRDALYYLVEVGAPEGYVLDSTPYYFEFKTAGAEALTVEDAEVHQLISGNTVTVVDQPETPKTEDPTAPASDDPDNEPSDENPKESTPSTDTSSTQQDQATVSMFGTASTGDNLLMCVQISALLLVCAGGALILARKLRSHRR
jgi:uncharacterized surface anchored protein